MAAKKAGLELCYYVLSGIGGNNHWQRHAVDTASLLNNIGPDFIRLRTLSLVRNAPLAKEWQSNQFVPISPVNRLKETKLLIENLDVINCELASDHVTNYLWGPEGVVFKGVDGILPKDKPRLIDEINLTLNNIHDRDDILDGNMMVEQGFIKHL